MVTGAGGLLGSEFRARIPSLGHEVVALSRAELDVTDTAAVKRTVTAVRPDAVLHCAALARVDHVETEPEEAYHVNRDAARQVAENAARAGARMVYFSTDYVFDGSARTPYAPDHPRGPLNAYARTKAEGEDAVRAVAPDALVVRLSWLFGGGGSGFVHHVLTAAREGRPLRVVRDQWSRPSWVANVVRNVVELLARDAPAGVWHVTDAGEANRVEEACEVLRITGLDAEIVEVSRDAFWPRVPRPAYSVLGLSATESFLGRPMEDWRDSLRRCLAG